MLTSKDIARQLPFAHEMLNAVRASPARYESIPGARVGVDPGNDSRFASATKNRATIYDPTRADLRETLRLTAEIYREKKIEHWFAEIGPGATRESLIAAMTDIGARPVPYVRYPVLTREPGKIAERPTRLSVRRVDADELASQSAAVDAIWEKPGASAAALNAVGKAGYAVVLAFDGAKAVGMGMLIAPERARASSDPGAEVGGGIGYLSAGGTHAAYRGLGAQSAIIAQRVRIAAEWGCDLCVSETVSAVMTSENNLRRAGFAVAYEWVMMEIGEYRGA